MPQDEEALFRKIKKDILVQYVSKNRVSRLGLCITIYEHSTEGSGEMLLLKYMQWQCSAGFCCLHACFKSRPGSVFQFMEEA